MREREHGAPVPVLELPRVEELHTFRGAEKQMHLELFIKEDEGYLLLHGPYTQGQTTLVQQVIEEGLLHPQLIPPRPQLQRVSMAYPRCRFRSPVGLRSRHHSSLFSRLCMLELNPTQLLL